MKKIIHFVVAMSFLACLMLPSAAYAAKPEQHSQKPVKNEAATAALQNNETPTPHGKTANERATQPKTSNRNHQKHTQAIGHSSQSRNTNTTTATTVSVARSTQESKGNNATVKVDGVEFDTHPNNEPHVGCSFQIDFYNYDKGSLFSNVTFEAQAPTGNSVLLTDRVFVGEDSATGGTDVDAQRTYNLASALANFTPHPKQGYHVKLTVALEGQKANGKHKVFWVTCASVTPPTGGNGGTTPGGSGGGQTLSTRTSQPSLSVQGASTLVNTGSRIVLSMIAALFLLFTTLGLQFKTRRSTVVATQNLSY